MCYAAVKRTYKSIVNNCQKQGEIKFWSCSVKIQYCLPPSGKFTKKIYLFDHGSFTQNICWCESRKPIPNAF